MTSLKQQFEQTQIYELSNITKSGPKTEEFSSIALLIDGVIDYNSFSDQIRNLFDSKIIMLKIDNVTVFISFDFDIEYFNFNIRPKLSLFHYDIFSIFLKDSLTKKYLDGCRNLKSNLYYIFFESTEIISLTSPNIQDFIISSSVPKKYLYGFNNFSDLISFYIEIVKSHTIWPIFAIKTRSATFYGKSIVKNQLIDVSKSNFPTFNPLSFLFYLSFIEKTIGNPKRMMNVKEIYSIKNIPDVQINHLYRKNKFDKITVRTFFGFESQIRCLQVFNFLQKLNKKESNSFIDIILINEMPSKFINFNIKYDLYYLEIKSIFDFSILFSMNYLDSIQIDTASTFISFNNYEDFIYAKQIFKTFNKKINYTLKNLKVIERNDISIIFPYESFSSGLDYFIIFQVKLDQQNNNLIYSSLENKSDFVKKNVTCILDDKKYFIMCFNDEKRRNEIFSQINDSENLQRIKSYYPINKGKQTKIKSQTESIPPMITKDETQKQLFIQKDGLFYIYFQEYKKSKLKYPTNQVHPLFGVKNIVDLQRNYMLPNDPNEYTFIGFATKENLEKTISDSYSRRNGLKVNALNGLIHEIAPINQVQIISTKQNNSQVNNANENLQTNSINDINKVRKINEKKIMQLSEINNNSIKNQSNNNSIKDQNNNNNAIKDQNNNNNAIKDQSNNNSIKDQSNNNSIKDQNNNNNAIKDQNNNNNAIKDQSNNNSIKDQSNNNSIKDQNNNNNAIKDQNNNNNSIKDQNNNNNAIKDPSNSSNIDTNIIIQSNEKNCDSIKNHLDSSISNDRQNKKEPANNNDKSINNDLNISIKDYLSKMYNYYIFILEFIENAHRKPNDIHDLIQNIHAQKIHENSHVLREILRIVLSIANNHKRSFDFLIKINQIISIFKDNMLNNFTNYEIYEIFQENLNILLFLFEEKILKMTKKIADDIIEHKIPKYSFFFYPEIKQYNSTKNNRKIESKINKHCVDMNDFLQKRKNGENPNQFCELIRNDLVDEFIPIYENWLKTKPKNEYKMEYTNKIINSDPDISDLEELQNTKPNFPKSRMFSKGFDCFNFDDEYIEKSKFETNSLLILNDCAFIQYAAFCGSSKIFKYFLKQKDYKEKSFLWILAIHSNNSEIINILLEYKIKLNPIKCLKEAIKCHHNEIALFFLKTFLDEIDDIAMIQICSSIKYRNYMFLLNDFLDCLTNEFTFYRFCKYDHIIPVKILLKTTIIDVNVTFILFYILIKFK